MAEDTNLWHKISGIHPNPVDNGYFHKNSEVIHRFHEQAPQLRRDCQDKVYEHRKYPGTSHHIRTSPNHTCRRAISPRTYPSHPQLTRYWSPAYPCDGGGRNPTTYSARSLYLHPRCPGAHSRWAARGTVHGRPPHGSSRGFLTHISSCTLGARCTQCALNRACVQYRH